MLGAYILDDELIIDDPEMIAKLQTFGVEWNCTPEEALRRILEREATERASRERSE